MTIYCCCQEPALGARPLLGLSDREFTFARVEVRNPPALLTQSCAALTQRAWLTVWDQIPDCTAAGSLARPVLARQLSCLFFHVASPFCCQRGVRLCGIEPPQSLLPGPGVSGGAARGLAAASQQLLWSKFPWFLFCPSKQVTPCLPRPAVNSTDLIFPGCMLPVAAPV